MAVCFLDAAGMRRGVLVPPSDSGSSSFCRFAAGLVRGVEAAADTPFLSHGSVLGMWDLEICKGAVLPISMSLRWRRVECWQDGISRPKSVFI